MNEVVVKTDPIPFHSNAAAYTVHSIMQLLLKAGNIFLFFIFDLLFPISNDYYVYL